MAKMDMCTAQIKLGGDARSVVHRDDFNPVSWPEVLILQFAHGDDSVSGVEVIETVDVDDKDYVARLKARYGENVFKAVFPGARPKIELKADPDVKRRKKIKVETPAPAEEAVSEAVKEAAAE